MAQRSPHVRVAAAISMAVLLLATLHSAGEDGFLLFHTLVEMVTIVVDVAIFVLAWNTRAYLGNNYLLFVGVASVFIGGIDLVHTLAYKGIGVFPDDSGNLATQLWIGARYGQSVSLVVAPFFLRRRLNVDALLGTLTLACTALLLAVFVWPVFPTAYVPGLGLTPFKKISEYVISALLVGAIGLLYRERREFEETVWRYLVIYLVLNIASEITFTGYMNLYGVTNVVGHVLRLAATYFLYKAIVETGLVQPYAILLRNLKRSEEHLRRDAATLQSRNEDLRRSEATLREHAAILQSRNEDLDAYAHTVAHDLKTPLSVIVSASEVIAMHATLRAEQVEELLQSVRSTALDMNAIVDELLLLAEVRKRDVRLQPLAMGDVVAAVLHRLDEMVEAYQGEVEVPSAWPVAMGYGPWIEQVWSNYITNALKYGGRPPRIRLGATTEPDGMASFWAVDNGPGIPPEARASLFLPFDQADRRHRLGHGLGLSIVSRIVDKLGGRAGVENEAGWGSRFYFALPLAPDPVGDGARRLEPVAR